MTDKDEAAIKQINWLRNIGVEYITSLEKNPFGMQPAGEKEMKEKEALNTIEPTTIAANKQETLFSPASAENAISLTSRKLADAANTLNDLREAVLNFDGCDLKKMATNTVFSDGNPNADIMLIGEAPGANEDVKGIPFCGESGKLLDKMLQTIAISRETNAYLTNTIFWRPPANRVPTKEEIEICRPFVEKHIALINPKLIILVGSTAATSLLGNHAGISKIRQEYYSYMNRYLSTPIRLTALFHPAYLLRQPNQKKTTWYDLLKIQDYIRTL